jgi:metallo-beta-lactamase family protein
MKIRFFGAARRVTGSCYHLRTGDMEILVDCGMYQGKDADDTNNKPFNSILKRFSIFSLPMPILIIPG